MRLSEAPDLLTLPEAAEILRCSEPTVYRLIRHGELRATKVASKTMVTSQAVREFLGLDTAGELAWRCYPDYSVALFPASEDGCRAAVGEDHSRCGWVSLVPTGAPRGLRAIDEVRA